MRVYPIFEKVFSDWLDESLKEAPPREVRAFAFGINRSELSFTVELNGTSEFDAIDSTWTWSECWQPAQPKLTVPSSVCCGQEEECRSRVKQTILDYLVSGVFARRLIRCEGVAIESFKAGYELIWRNPTPKQNYLSPKQLKTP